MIKCGDSTSDPDHGKDRSDSDAYQVMRKDKTNRDCQTDIKKVETIFGKSYAFVDEIGDCLNNSISGIGDDTHVQRHGGTDACQNDGNDQKEENFRQKNPDKLSKDQGSYRKIYSGTG